MIKIGTEKDLNKISHLPIRSTIQNIGKGGIRVQYGDNSTMRLVNALKQSLFSNIKQANTDFSDYIIQKFGYDGYEIDYHANSRPSHRFMQGKQYCIGETRTVNGTMFVGFEEVDPTSPDGLSAAKVLTDYNCRHYRIPIICGTSRPQYSAAELAELK